MADETRSKLVCATVVAIGLLFAMLYAERTIHSHAPQTIISLATVYGALSAYR